MKACPFCAEEIQDAAVVCKHCGRDLMAGVSSAGGPAPESHGQAKPAATTPRSTAVGWFSIMAVLMVAYFIWTSLSPHKPSVITSATAVYACQEVTRVLQDARAGVLTGFELRVKIQSVYDEYGRLIDRAVAPGVAENLQALLSAMTSGSTEETARATANLTNACNAVPK